MFASGVGMLGVGTDDGFGVAIETTCVFKFDG